MLNDIMEWWSQHFWLLNTYCITGFVSSKIWCFLRKYSNSALGELAVSVSSLFYLALQSLAVCKIGAVLWWAWCVVIWTVVIMMTYVYYIWHSCFQNCGTSTRPERALPSWLPNFAQPWTLKPQPTKLNNNTSLNHLHVYLIILLQKMSDSINMFLLRSELTYSVKFSSNICVVNSLVCYSWTDAQLL